MVNCAALPLFTLIAFGAFVLALFPPLVTTIRTGSIVEDSRGRKVYLDLPARRVLIFSPILSSYLTLDETTVHVLAAAKFTRDQTMRGVLPHIYPGLQRVLTAGGSIAPRDPELVMLLQPDAVFAGGLTYAPLKEVEMPGLIEVNVGLTRDKQMLSLQKVWLLIGRVADKNYRANALMKRYLDKLQALKALIPEQAGKKMQVVYLNGYAGLGLIGGKDFYLNYALSFVGAENAARNFSFSGVANLEQVLLLDPDIILLDSTLNYTPPQMIYGQPEWLALKAVRMRRVYTIPLFMYYSAPIDDPLRLLWMAEIFYPDAMAHKLRDEFRETYRTVYHYAISDDEIDKAIFLKENISSAGYNRFVRSGRVH